MPDWKKLFPKPAGALPGGFLTNVGVGLLSVLVAATLISYQFCGARREPDGGGTQNPETVSGARDFQDQIGSLTAQQRRERDRELTEQKRQQQPDERDMLAAGVGGGRVSGAPVAVTRPGVSGREGVTYASGQPPESDAEAELLERLRLDDLERRHRSLRVGPVVHSKRGEIRTAARQEGAAQEVSAGEPTHPVRDDSSQVMRSALDNFQSTIQALAAAETTTAAPSDAGLAGAAALSPPVAPTADDYADPTRITTPTDPSGAERIYEGSFLEAVLVTQLSGEFTGPVLATVTVPFYSTDRQRVLVPRGTRAIGSAQAVGSADQTRLAVGFHRLIFPDGRWLALKFDGLAQAGEGALKDQVNRHYLSMFAAVGAVGVMSGLTLRGSHPYAGGMAGIRAGAGQAMGQAGTQILSRFLNRYPTITIRAGHRLRIWFTSDVLVPRPPPPGEQQ